MKSLSQARDHKTDSSHSGVEVYKEYPRENTSEPNVVHAHIIAEAIRASAKNINKHNRKSDYHTYSRARPVLVLTRLHTPYSDMKTDHTTSYIPPTEPNHCTNIVYYKYQQRSLQR